MAAKRKYILRMEIIKIVDTEYGTGYDKDKIITPGENRKMLDMSAETETLEDALELATYQIGGVKE